MGDKTKIEWVRGKDGKGATWSSITGCSAASSGCDHCYSRALTKRLRAMGQKKYVNGFKVTCHDNPHVLEQPIRWKRGRKIFVNSMSDTFHEKVPFEFIEKIYNVMMNAHWHKYWVLTKRPERMVEFLKSRVLQGHSRHDLYWHPCEESSWMENVMHHVYHGVTVENQEVADERIPLLLQCPAAVRFVSCEPCLSYIDLSKYFLRYRAGCPDLDPNWPDMFDEPRGPTKCVLYPNCECGESDRMIDQVICGGESGPGARPMDLEWARSLKEQCKDAGVKFFMKQLGSVWAKKNNSKTRKGEDPSEWPEDLRVQELVE